MQRRETQKRIVMLLSNPATYDERPLKEARSLTRAGFSVTILAWDRDKASETDSRLPEGVEIKRMKLYAGHGTPLLTVPKLFIFYVWCIAHLVFESCDAVHCHDVDTLPGGFAAKLLSLGRTRLVYDMHDLPESFLRFFPLSSVTQRIFLALSKKLADLVVVVNDRFVAHLGSIGFKKDRVVVVMNAPPASEGRRRTRVQDGFRVLYFGWLGEERGVRLLVDAVQGLENVNLVLAGRGELEKWVRAAEMRNPHIRFAGWLKMSELTPLIQEADLIPSLYEPRTTNAQLATPGKFLKSLALSLPALVPKGSYQGEIVDKYGCGFTVEWGNVGEIRRAILSLSKDVALYDKMADSAYGAFQSSYSWEVMETRLTETYARLLRIE